MRLLNHLVTGSLLLLLVSACATKNHVATPGDFYLEGSLDSRASRPAVSLTVSKELPMVFSLGLEDSDIGRAYYNYEGAFEAALVNVLSENFELTEPTPGTPHVELIFAGPKAHGSCRNAYGGLSTCSQHFTLNADFFMTLDGFSIDPTELQGKGSATEGGYLFLPSSIEPLHRKAVRSAFLEFSERLISKISASIVFLNRSISA